jgi:tRNA1Val (adenine37-N6)-methyltransferase
VEVTLDSIRDIKLYQYKNGYRFSVDALLLYSFVNIPRAKKIADLGAGSGIVGLLLANKYPGSAVTLFELQAGLASLATRNVVLNSLEERVTVIEKDIREFGSRAASSSEHRFDIVVSNPPFRRPGTGLISPGEERAVARHEIKLKLPELVRAAHALLRAKGRFFLIHHPSRLSELVDTLREKRMEVKRLRFVHSNILSGAKTVLVEAVRDGAEGLKVDMPFFIYDMKGGYSDEMREVYGET